MKQNTVFYNKGISQSLQILNANASQGLTADEAARRLLQNGANRLQSAKKKSLLLRILAQFKDFLVIILITAAVISVIAGDGLKDAIIITAILTVNMIIGITQENKADNALKELKDMSSPKAKVKRDGQVIKIDSDGLVTGDIVILDAGDYVPADIRIIEGTNLKIDESALTGESAPVEKDAETVLESGTGLSDRINCASMGTVVTCGRGTGVVCATGTDTEMGKIAALLNETDEAATPLQDKLNSMAKTLGIICIITCALIFGIGFLYSMDLLEMLMVSVSLAVAAVPEGIAIIATVILAIGVQKMVRRNVIVKKLRAVETLGSTTVICSDKTGTMTQNKMTVTEQWTIDNKQYTIDLLLKCGALCNNTIKQADTGGYLGDPTEIALMTAAVQAGVDISGYERIGEIPFDSATKFMQVSYAGMDYLKGSLEAVMLQCNTNDNKIKAVADEMAGKALRVLAFAYRKTGEERFTFIGIQGMIDPPREEVKESVEMCRTAGINVKMITGDHKITAGAIAKTLGIMNDGDMTLEGSELDNLTDEELREKVKTVNVFARVSPEHKVRIVTAIRENNNIVAMTGDGVNDAPSLKKANIGIAMGITGTDVSKEAADMVLTDDNFVSIVGALEQGRTIYDNIRKVTGYLFSCNIGELLIIFLAIAFGLPVPLVATQLLFMNLLTDAFPAFALGMERKEAGVMKRCPRDPKEPIINKSMKSSVALRSLLVCAGALGAFLYGFNFHSYEIAVSMCFFTLVASELLIAYPSKTEAPLCFRRGLWENHFLNISIALSLVILIAVMYLPVLNGLFMTVPLNIAQFAVCTGFTALPLTGSELSKKLFPRSF
ncbi:MAG: cation-translocating P-type ATPase [Oscillospiraceae bacterium]|jgi:Ca2+-transporting ATPase|nr:cation-translocating P-type ATPase [Oscillospiraceae bacterium]